MYLKTICGSVFFNIEGDSKKIEDELDDKIANIETDRFNKEFEDYSINFDVEITTPSEYFTHILNIYGFAKNNDYCVDTQNKLENILKEVFGDYEIIKSFIDCKYKDD